MPCKNTYIYFKTGCSVIRRVVHTNDNDKKYIKDKGKHILLSSIRGKYRYADNINVTLNM